MKKVIAVLLLFLLLPVSRAGCAQEYNFGFTDQQTPNRADAFCCSYRLYPESPIYDLVICDTAKRRSENSLRENVLSVTLTARDGSLSQQFEYDSAETPSTVTGGTMAWMDDINFDGYDDLVLCAGRGASNEFSVFCVWNPHENRFDEVMTEARFDLTSERFGDIVPLELVNYELQPSSKNDEGMVVPPMIISNENDGCAAHTRRFYQWEQGSTGATPHLIAVFDVYETENDRIGERMYTFASQGVKLWDTQYPSQWYYETNAYQDHMDAADAVVRDSYVAKCVTHSNWVHLREMDSKRSRSLARLDKGEEVRVLKENCADGWTLVLWNTWEAQDGGWFGNKMMIGYVWHSFLQ